MKIRIIVDIDGTICHNTDGNYEQAKPLPDKIKVFNELFDSGEFEIVYWTARGMKSRKDWLELTKKQLKVWGVKYHNLWMRKPSYDLWIDDKCLNVNDFINGSSIQDALKHR